MTEQTHENTGHASVDHDAGEALRRIRAAIEAGITDSRAGRTIPVEAVRAQFGLEP